MSSGGGWKNQNQRILLVHFLDFFFLQIKSWIKATSWALVILVCWCRIDSLCSIFLKHTSVLFDQLHRGSAALSSWKNCLVHWFQQLRSFLLIALVFPQRSTALRIWKPLKQLQFDHMWFFSWNTKTTDSLVVCDITVYLC